MGRKGAHGLSIHRVHAATLEAVGSAPNFSCRARSLYALVGACLELSGSSAGTSLKSQSVALRPGSPRWCPGTDRAAAGNPDQASYGTTSRHMARAKAKVYPRPHGLAGAAWPNPSFKRSANGRPPAPGRWYAVHFHRPGAGVLPLSPA